MRSASPRPPDLLAPDTVAPIPGWRVQWWTREVLARRGAVPEMRPGVLRRAERSRSNGDGSQRAARGLRRGREEGGGGVRAANCLSDLFLDRWRVRELSEVEEASVKAHAHACAACARRERELAEEALDFDVPLRLPRRARRSLRRSLPLAAAAAAASLLLFLPSTDSPGIRTKGGASLSVIARRAGGTIEPVLPGIRWLPATRSASRSARASQPSSRYSASTRPARSRPTWTRWRSSPRVRSSSRGRSGSTRPSAPSGSWRSSAASPWDGRGCSQPAPRRSGGRTAIRPAISFSIFRIARRRPS